MSGPSDTLWAIIEREVMGEKRKYVEYYDPNISVDSGVCFDEEEPVSEVEGLNHLAGKSVMVVGDGLVYGPLVVSDFGEVELDPPAKSGYVGLKYDPELITNKPEVSIGGTSQGVTKGWSRVYARVINTRGLEINGQPDEKSVPYTGDIKVGNLGYNKDGRITVRQTLPLPAHITCIFGTLYVGDD